MAGFTFTQNDGSGRFRIGRKPSVFIAESTFTLTKCITGTWSGDQGLINKDGTNTIRFLTSLSEDIDDAVNINKLTNRRRIVYDQNGRATVLYDFEQHAEFVAFLESLGRDETDSRFLKGTAKQIGDAVLKYFEGKVFVVKEHDVFFKEIKDGVEKLVLPISPVLTLSLKD